MTQRPDIEHPARETTRSARVRPRLRAVSEPRPSQATLPCRRDDQRTGLFERRRSVWRQRLVEAESGVRLSLRADATLFVHLFVISGILAAAFVLGLNTMQWAIVVLALTLVVSAEMFQQMLRVLWKEAGHHLPPPFHEAIKIGTAAVVLSSIGAVVALLLVFGQRVARML